MTVASFWNVLFSRRMIVSGLMGFSCGLPLLLTISVLQAWMKDEGVDLSVIGLMALVGLPYTLKFFWSPLLDRFTLPFLGRRRGWLLIAQLLLALSIVGLGLTDPSRSPWLVAFVALLVTFFSASQDIVVDAYRREDLADEELGLGSSMYVNGYRVGMLLASGGGLILADHMPFSSVYLIMAACMLPGIVTTLTTTEPDVPDGTPISMREAVFEPFIDYFTRTGAVWILAFILLYKIGDQMASAMTTPFYLDIGFSKSEIGTVVKLFGFWATIIGSFVGGVVMLKLGIIKSLWGFGILQGVSTAGFAFLAYVGPSIPALTAVIAFENLTSGMGTSAYVAFMASLTNKRFTATQYALLSSLMGIPRVFASAPTGFLAEFMGWGGFFVLCSLVALPGLVLIWKIGGRLYHSEDVTSSST
jgi:MFS transporter, PAT family, beta-lactamase induction signal transducer AmpG